MEQNEGAEERGEQGENYREASRARRRGRDRFARACARSLMPILNTPGTFRAGAIRAAVIGTIDLHAMTDDAAPAM